MTSTLLNRSVVVSKTNKSGGAHAQGDVCVEDTGNANAVVNNTDGAYTAQVIWVCIEPAGVADNESGLYACAGFVPKINLDTSAALGDFVGTSTTTQQGTPHASPSVAGDFAQVLGTGTSPAAVLFGVNYGGGGISIDQADPYGIHHRLSGSNADDDEFSSDTSADYTAVNPTGTAIWTIANHVLSCKFSGQSAADAAAFLKPMTLADGESFETRLELINKAATNYLLTGLIISDGVLDTSNCLVVFCLLKNTNQLELQGYTGTITNLASVFGVYATEYALHGGLRLQLKRNSSTSFQWLISLDNGVNFENFGSAVADPGFTPTHAGVFVTVWGGAQTAIAAFDYLRHL